MRNIKLTIEYDGTNFYGWQIQKQRQRTVQGELEKVLKLLFKNSIRLIGSGRTDSGVHALGQIANFKTTRDMPAAEMQRAFNANLPHDISVLNVEEAVPHFHAQFSAKRKLYRYTLLYRKTRSTRNRLYSLHYPFQLNLTAMRNEAHDLIGKRNFRSFTSTDPALRRQNKHKDTVRTLYRFDILKRGDYVFFDLEANGFLYKMVRNIVGTLLEYGSGRREPGCLLSILSERDRLKAGETAPAHGLCLMHVSY